MGATKTFFVSKGSALMWRLCAHAAALWSSGLRFPQTDTYSIRVWRGWFVSPGDFLLPNDTQAVSCYRWAAFCSQGNVTVVPELVPHWRLILGEREKSGQCGSH